jgi:hypothetical protein
MANGHLLYEPGFQDLKDGYFFPTVPALPANCHLSTAICDPLPEVILGKGKRQQIRGTWNYKDLSFHSSQDEPDGMIKPEFVFV